MVSCEWKEIHKYKGYKFKSYSLDIALTAFLLFAQVNVFYMLRFSLPVNISFLSFCLSFHVSYATWLTSFSNTILSHGTSDLVAENDSWLFLMIQWVGWVVLCWYLRLIHAAEMEGPRWLHPAFWHVMLAAGRAPLVFSFCTGWTWWSQGSGPRSEIRCSSVS